jgi:Uma2 family endonuclease
MAPATTSLTVSQYDARYGSESGWEYWFGEPRRKPAPAKFHGILQSLLAGLLRLAGYISAVEAELRNVPDCHPHPDVYGVLEEFEGAYPSRPVDVVFEVLSPQENIATKCRIYSDSLIPAVVVFDPAEQTISSWDGKKLQPVVDVKLANGVTITGTTIWFEFAKRQKQTPPVSMTI